MIPYDETVDVARALAAAQGEGLAGFPSRLLRARRRAELTQRELGFRIERDNKMISHYETGRCLPTFEALVRLSDVLDVSIDYLLKGEER